MAWGQFCRPNERRGLGIGNICTRNKTLLGKWWWRFSNEGESLWKKTVVWLANIGHKIIGVTWGTAKRVIFRSPWKFISIIYQVFLQSVRVVVKGADNIRFWENRWWLNSFFLGSLSVFIPDFDGP